MSDLKIQGEVSLDTTNADEALVKVEKGASRMAEAVGNAGKKAGTGLSEIGNGGDASAAKVDKSTRSIVASIQRATALMEAGSKTSTKYYEALANQRGVSVDALRPYLDQLEKVQQSQTKVGISANQTAAAMRNVPAQFTDIITSLQGGQAPLTVFLQQGGQLKDMFGGAGNAAKALGGYVFGLINPVTIATAAVGGLAYVYAQSNNEAKEFSKALITSNNAAGLSVDVLRNLSTNIEAVGASSRSVANDSLLSLVGAGNVASSMIEKAALASVNAQTIMGKAVADTAKEFAELGKSPTSAVEKLNEKYHFLTMEIYDQIKAYEDQGRAADAAKLAQSSYADVLLSQSSKVKETLTDWERGWLRIKTATSGAFNSVMTMFDDPTQNQKIDQLLKNRDALEASFQAAQRRGVLGNGVGQAGYWEKALEQNKAEINAIRDKIKAKNDEAKAEEEKNKRVAAGIQWSSIVEKNLDKQAKLELEITKVRAIGLAAGKSSAEIEKEIATIRTNGTEKAKKAILDQSLAWKAHEVNVAAAGKAETKALSDIDKSISAIKFPNALKQITDEFEKQTASFVKINAGLDEYALGLQGQNELTQLELSLIGQSATERGILVEQYKIELALQKEIRKIKSEIKDAGSAQILIDKATSNANVEKSQVALKVQQQEWTKFYGDIYNGLTDSLYRGFEAGKGFFRSFWDGIKNLFKTTVLKVGVQAVMTGVFGIGTMGQANAMQAMGQSGADPISMISAGKSMYEGFASGFSGFGDSIANYVQAGLDKAGLSMTGGGNSAFATGAGTAASYLGGAAVGVYGGRALSGGYSVTGGNAAVNIGTIAGAIFGGPIGAAIGGLIGGGVNRLFGRKAAELQSSELSGTVGAGGFSASTRDVYVAKGGLFRSDKWSETNTAMTDTAGLTAQYEAIKAAATGYASMLGLSATAIDSYTKSFTFSLSKTGDAAKDAEANQKMLADLFVGISDDITKLVAPSIAALTKEGETASQTLGRLAMGLTSVNGVMVATGFAEFAKSLEGANAAQRLIDLSGGIETLASGAQYFFENFLTEAEKIKPSADRVTETMQRLGQSSVDTMEEFKLLVQGLDLATESGAKMYAELIAIAPQFKAVADYTKETVKVSETYVDVQFNAQRKVEAAAIAATQALEAQARATMELAKAEKQKTYDDALQSRLRSGKIGEIMSSNYELNPVDFGKYVSAGQFDAAGFNSEILRQQAKLSLELIAKASADAINIEDVASVVGGLFDFTKGNEFRQILRQQLPQGTGLANDVGYVMFDFIESALEGIRLDKYAASGQGVINVINARDQIGYQTDLLTQYNRSLSSAAEALRLGIVTQDEYTGAIAKANEILKDQVKTQDELSASLKQAGIDSIAFYFDQIGLSVERLNEAAEKAAEPLAVVTSAIGRFTSISDVFSLSANAAGDVGGNADLVAQSAKIAAQVLTTQSAAQAAKELAAKASFSGQSASQLRDISLLIEGVKQFDPNSFEAGFLRISDALNKGTIDQAQYQDLFSASLNMFNGVESESTLLAKTMGDLRASMRGFADSLLIDKSKTTLSDSARMQEVMRQYDAAKIGAMTGDASSISLFQSLGSQLAAKENYSSRAEANYGFSRVLADSEMLVRYADQKTSGEMQTAAIQSMEKSMNERMDKQFAIMLAQLKELQDANVNQVRASLPA